MILCNMFDFEEDGSGLKPGYADETRSWVLGPDEITDEYVTAALASANRAWQSSIDYWSSRMGRSSDGFIADVAGFAWCTITKPSRRLLFSLKRANAFGHPQNGPVYSFWHGSDREQSMTLYEKAAQAQCRALQKAFPDEDISWVSYID